MDFVSQASVAAFDATIFDVGPYGSLPLLFAFQVSNSITIDYEISDTMHSLIQRKLGIILYFLDV